MTTKTPLSNVSDTALWVAMYRAMESERPDALFNDPFARRLAGERGETIVNEMVRGRQSAWPMIVRTAVMDEIIERWVRDGYDTVLNLAAGLDTRPYRLKLPADLRWFDVDLPDISMYKQNCLDEETPHCHLQYEQVDLTNAEDRVSLLARVCEGSSKTLVVTEGLLVYLAAESVAAIARDLAGQPAIKRWLTDLASPRLMKMLQRTWGKQLDKGNAPFVFAPPEGTAFFSPFGWEEIEFRPTFEEALRLKRTMRLAWLWQFLGRLSSKKKQEEFRRMSGIVLFGRAGG